MIVTIVLSISVVLQFMAAVFALRLIRVTEKSGPWLLIAIAIILMGIRRFITLSRLISGNLALQPDLAAELVALVISILMVVGIAWILPFSRSIRNSKKVLQHSKIWLIVAGMFGLLCIFSWFNEILDLPHILLGAPSTPLNWRESLIEMVMVAIVGFFMVSKIQYYITEHKRAEESIKHLNSVLKAIRNVNQLIVTEKDRDSLLLKTCDAMVEARGYDAAWLGLLGGGKAFSMVKGAGFGENVNRFSEYVMKGDHPPCIKKALTKKNTLIIVDKSKECGDCFFKGACVGKEAAIIRVEHGGKLFGLFAILFSSNVSVDEEEKGLLKEVATDIAFALYSLEIEEARKHAEEALKKAHDELEVKVGERTAELTSVNKELEAFAYSISHDLRAPLRAIDGFSQILLEEYSDVLNGQGKHYLARTRAGTQNMGQLIDDLLSLSRIGRQEMKKKTVKMETIVREAYASLEDERRDRKVDFKVCECPSVLADSRLMKIVFTNLLSNALKFTRREKKAKIEVGYEDKDNQTIFFVRDNGVGFDMKYADKLFTPFQRLHKTDEYEGTGIGLAIIRRIINRHGGHIWVESKPSSGTTFYFTIPS